MKKNFQENDRLEEIGKADLVANTEADMVDLLENKIKDVEHLNAIDELMDDLCNIEETARNIASQDESTTYRFINGKSIEQLGLMHKQLQQINENLKDIFKFS